MITWRCSECDIQKTTEGDEPGMFCVKCKNAMERIDYAVDNINPDHYKKHPSGVECIAIIEHFNFNLGNAIKYIWRAGLKEDVLEDLKKAQWYINREIGKLENDK